MLQLMERWGTRVRHIDLELADEIVAAYVSNNSIPISELPRLIQTVHAAISALSCGDVLGAPLSAAESKKPSAVEIRKSVQHDGIVSFIDGKAYKTIKRHLTAHGLHPQSYRERYGLPPDYPMVAPSYAERRSTLAKSIGLGRPGAMAQRERKTRTGS